MLKGDVLRAAELRAIMSDIQSDSHRAGNVIRKLRVLFRKDTPVLIAIDLNNLIADTIALAKLRPALTGVPIRLRLARALPLVRGDAVQIQQVLFNLIHNSAEAMQAVASRERGMVVRARTDEDSEVVVCVTDTGPGISAKDVEHIFEAFMTSKPDGMGMGLYVSRSIVITHGGAFGRTAIVAAALSFAFPYLKTLESASNALFERTSRSQGFGTSVRRGSRARRGRGFRRTRGEISKATGERGSDHAGRIFLG
jgi:C4-dicarboxylate-specific signal transduction histidine kinase